jgi:peptide/nickel transport system permease protein
MRRKDPYIRPALIILGALIVLGVVGPLLAPQDPYATSAVDQLRPPSGEHWLGTDRYGRDVFSRVLTAFQVDLLGTLAVAIVIGAIGVGLMRARQVLAPQWGQMRRLRFWVVALAGSIMVWLVSLPIAIAVVGLFDNSGVLVALVSIVVGLLPWAALMGLVGDVRPRYQAATAVLTWAWAIVILAGLGYLGLGVPEPRPELGSMLGISNTGWWAILPPLGLLALFVVLILLSAHLISREPPRPRTPTTSVIRRSARKAA